jgi:hypothetical protein
LGACRLPRLRPPVAGRPGCDPTEDRGGEGATRRPSVYEAPSPGTGARSGVSVERTTAQMLSFEDGKVARTVVNNEGRAAGGL